MGEGVSQKAQRADAHTSVVKTVRRLTGLCRLQRRYEDSADPDRVLEVIDPTFYWKFWSKTRMAARFRTDGFSGRTTGGGDLISIAQLSSAIIAPWSDANPVARLRVLGAGAKQSCWQREAGMRISSIVRWSPEFWWNPRFCEVFNRNRTAEGDVIMILDQ